MTARNRGSGQEAKVLAKVQFLDAISMLKSLVA
jgi:hypothetical protein